MYTKQTFYSGQLKIVVFCVSLCRFQNPVFSRLFSKAYLIFCLVLLLFFFLKKIKEFNVV